MNPQAAKRVTEKLRVLRTRAGLTVAELAKATGYKTGSGVQRYLSDTDYSRIYFHPDLVAKLCTALVGLGDPPITEREVLELGAPSTGPAPLSADEAAVLDAYRRAPLKRKQSFLDLFGIDSEVLDQQPEPVAVSRRPFGRS